MPRQGKTHENIEKQYDLLIVELKYSQNKIKSLEKYHISQVNKVSDKYLSEHEIDLQDFIVTGLERKKLASIIYGVSKSKREGMGYSERCSNRKSQLLKKTSNPSSQAFLKQS